MASNTTDDTDSSSALAGLRSEGSTVIGRDRPQESEFIDVRPTNKLIRLSREHRDLNSMGHMDTPVGDQLSRALIDEGIMENIISLHFAERYGFKVCPLGEGEEDIRVEFNGWRQRCMGVVTMNWYPDPERLHISFPIRCFVWDHHLPGFFFGRVFWQRGSTI